MQRFSADPSSVVGGGTCGKGSPMLYVKSLIALLALGTTPLLASCPSVRFIRQAVVVVQAQAVLVPSYGASYGQQQSPELVDLLRRILDSLERLERKLEAGSPVPVPVMDGKAIFESSCLKCHQPATMEKAGTDLAFVDATGKLEPLSLEQKRRIKNRVEVKGSMPPGKPLPPDQAKALVDWLTANREK